MEEGNSDIKETDNKDLNKENVKPSPPKKPPKIEEKPFDEFICQHLIPGIKTSLESKGVQVKDISLTNSLRPVIGDKCWVLFGEINDERKFWLCFSDNKISSTKTISLAESGSKPSLIESFLIDEKKITLQLLISRLIQRLNGQKWVGPN